MTIECTTTTEHDGTRFVATCTCGEYTQRTVPTTSQKALNLLLACNGAHLSGSARRLLRGAA